MASEMVERIGALLGALDVTLPRSVDPALSAPLVAGMEASVAFYRVRQRAAREGVARAILDAIREPTSGMVYAGGNSKTARVWRDMIDAALGEG